MGCSYATVADAIAAAVNGDTISVASGSYAGGFTVDKSLTLLGAAGATITSGDPAITITSTDTVTIDGFTFDGTGRPISAPVGCHVVIQNNTIKNTVGNATLYFGNPSTFVFKNNTLTNLSTSSDEGIFIAGNWNGTTGTVVTITGNTFSNSAMTGMNLSNVSGDVSGNTFKNIAYYGILVANNSSPLTITNNVFDGITSPDTSISTYGAGIRFYTPAFTGTVTIMGNTFKNSYIGIGVRAPADLTGMTINVNHNIFKNNITDIKNDSTVGTGTLNVSLNYWGGSEPILGGANAAGTVYSNWYTDEALTQLDSHHPQVTINQSASQADPSVNNSSLTYTVVWSEPINTSTFTCADIQLTNANCTSVALVSENTYTVTV